MLLRAEKDAPERLQFRLQLVPVRARRITSRGGGPARSR